MLNVAFNVCAAELAAISVQKNPGEEKLQEAMDCLLKNPTEELVMAVEGGRTEGKEKSVVARFEVFRVSDPNLRDHMKKNGYVELNPRSYRSAAFGNIRDYSNLPKVDHYYIKGPKEKYGQWFGHKKEGPNFVGTIEARNSGVVANPGPSGASSRYDNPSQSIYDLTRPRSKKPEVRTGRRSEDQLKSIAQDINKRFEETYSGYEGPPCLSLGHSDEISFIKFNSSAVEQAFYQKRLRFHTDMGHKNPEQQAGRETRNALKWIQKELIKKGLSFAEGDHTRWD